MATYAFVDLELKDAGELADLFGIAHDLRSTINLARYLDGAMQQDRYESEIVDALSTAILVRYSRAFTTGLRRHLGEDSLTALTGSQRTEHDRLRAFRDKHIAHSVNAFEENQVIARYWKETVRDQGISEVSVIHVRRHCVRYRACYGYIGRG